MNMKSVAPCTFHFDLSNALISPFMDVISGPMIGVLICCSFQMVPVTVKILPPFRPTAYLFKKYAHTG